MCTLEQMLQLAKSYKKLLLGGNQKYLFVTMCPNFAWKKKTHLSTPETAKYLLGT